VSPHADDPLRGTMSRRLPALPVSLSMSTLAASASGIPADISGEDFAMPLDCLGVPQWCSLRFRSNAVC
jgi:hypothetical protein